MPKRIIPLTQLQISLFREKNCSVQATWHIEVRDRAFGLHLAFFLKTDDGANNSSRR